MEKPTNGNIRIPQWIVQTIFGFLLVFISGGIVSLHREISGLKSDDAVMNEKLIQNSKEHAEIFNRLRR